MPDTPSVNFPALQSTGEVPWPDLIAAIDALVAQPDLWPSVAEKFPDTHAVEDDDEFLFLYVPYILGMAAVKLPEPHQSAIIACLVDLLEKSLAVGWDFPIEVINVALELIGPPALEPLMASIDRVPETELFPLTQWFLAADIAAALPVDAPARQKLADKIMPLLRNPEGWPGDEDLIAHVAGRLQIPGARPLIENLLKNLNLDVIDRREIQFTLDAFDSPEEIKTPDALIKELADKVESFHKMASDRSEDRGTYSDDPDDDTYSDDDDLDQPLDSFDPDAAAISQAVDQLITNLGINPAAPIPQDDLPPEIPDPFIRQDPKTGRNDPCPCGSGKKYKKCHGK